jgi:UDP-galactopyranose mutase
MNSYAILIVGCGLSGVVIAEKFASVLNKKVLIIDKRDHIGGMLRFFNTMNKLATF